MRALTLKPNHKRIAAYHQSPTDFGKLGVKHESAVRAAFQALLEDCTALVNKGRADKWKIKRRLCGQGLAAEERARRNARDI